MKYKRDEIESNLYQTSKSQKGGFLLPASACGYKVYGLLKLFAGIKNTDLSKKLSLVLVYNVALHYGKGICQISKALNTITPKKGDVSRNVTAPKVFENDDEFSQAVMATKNRYEGQFYKEIRFMDKKDFEVEYIDAGYFKNLTEWLEMDKIIRTVFCLVVKEAH